MTYANLHLHLSAHLAPAPTTAIDYACEAAKLLEATLSVSSARLPTYAPTAVADSVAMTRLVVSLEQSVTQEAARLSAYVVEKAQKCGIAIRLADADEQAFNGAAGDCWQGRVSDLCILGLSSETDMRQVAEDWLFGSGRPCLLYPERSERAFALNNVLVCWDYSRTAARAVADALPLLHNAGKIHVVVFGDDKSVPRDAIADLGRFLSGHGIPYSAATVDCGGRTIGEAMREHAAKTEADIIVMGGYGQSRAREFVLGGATREMLQRSAIPLLMSH
ncbi:MAG: universal stress protein [Alphaproteobacteria bacterium]